MAFTREYKLHPDDDYVLSDQAHDNQCVVVPLREDRFVVFSTLAGTGKYYVMQVRPDAQEVFTLSSGDTPAADGVTRGHQLAIDTGVVHYGSEFWAFTVSESGVVTFGDALDLDPDGSQGSWNFVEIDPTTLFVMSYNSGTNKHHVYTVSRDGSVLTQSGVWEHPFHDPNETEVWDHDQVYLLGGSPVATSRVVIQLWEGYGRSGGHGQTLLVDTTGMSIVDEINENMPTGSGGLGPSSCSGYDDWVMTHYLSYDNQTGSEDYRVVAVRYNSDTDMLESVRAGRKVSQLFGVTGPESELSGTSGIGTGSSAGVSLTHYHQSEGNRWLSSVSNYETGAGVWEGFVAVMEREDDGMWSLRTADSAQDPALDLWVGGNNKSQVAATFNDEIGVIVWSDQSEGDLRARLIVPLGWAGFVTPPLRLVARDDPLHWSGPRIERLAGEPSSYQGNPVRVRQGNGSYV